jgi:hypothetical protein
MIEIESYIREGDKQEYHRFCMHHIPRFSRAPPTELWHYTSADGLISILQSGKLWSTQITCLNDTLEQRFFGDLVHAAVKKRRALNTDSKLAVLFQVADEALADRDFTAVGHFVTCFSEVEDDLGQWRGYGGGECGYAIGFPCDGIVEAVKSCRPGALLLPMNYDETVHDFLVQDVLRVAETYFLNGLRRSDVNDIQKWAKDFLEAFAVELDIFACLIKHPKFSGEAERRITTTLQPGEHSKLEFRQKRTLLARHLPLDFTIGATGEKRLPITRIYVGPGPSHQVCRISVGDLLLKHGYQGIKVEVSKVPYRVP